MSFAVVVDSGMEDITEKIFKLFLALVGLRLFWISFAGEPNLTDLVKKRIDMRKG